MIECGRRPRYRGVAQRAIGGEACGQVIRIGGAGVIGSMARIACRRGALVHIVDVACAARQRGMCSGQCIACVLQVVELCVEPRVHGVAAFARGWKAGGDVIECRRAEVFLVAAVAGSRKACELARGCIFVTVFALQKRVRTNQRKAILMVANLLERNLPTLDAMAALTIGAKLAAVNIRVAIGTLRSNLFEDKIGVALCAGHLGMHAAQRIAR